MVDDGSCIYLAPLRRYGASKIMGSRPWPFGVTWLHRSHDHSTPGGGLPMGGPQRSCIYLAQLRRYGTSKIMGSRDVIGHESIRLPSVDFLCVVHCDHASI